MATSTPQQKRVYPLVSARVSLRTDAQLKRLCRPRERSRMVAILLDTILNAREWEDRGELLRAVQLHADALAASPPKPSAILLEEARSARCVEVAEARE